MSNFHGQDSGSFTVCLLYETKFSILSKLEDLISPARSAMFAKSVLAPYSLSLKLSDFTVLRHTWRKNWVNCAALTGNSAGLRTVFPVIFHTENCAVHSGSPTVTSVYLPTPRWHHLKAHPFLAIHSADEHHMLHSFSNTTPYSTFYALISSFRITLWPMWLANSKRQPCFYPP